MDTSKLEKYEKIRIESRVISPREAHDLLLKNTDNRTITKNNVSRISVDLVNGDFLWSNDMICVCEDGALLNGQHRLMAIEETMIPAWVTIAYNVPRESVIDKGKPRSNGEQLKIMGILDERLSNRRIIATAKSYLESKVPFSHALSMQQMGQFILKHGDNLHSANVISQRGGHKVRLYKSKAQAAIFAALELGYPEEDISHFVTIVNSGFGAESRRDNIAIALMNTLIDISASDKVTVNTSGSWLTKLVEQAIFDYENDKSIRFKRYNISKIDGHPLISQCDAGTEFQHDASIRRSTI